MNRNTKFMIFLVVLLMILCGDVNWAVADDYHGERIWYEKIFDSNDDDNDHKRRRRERKRRHRKGEGRYGRYLKPVDNPAYKEECGACHFAYQPELLPSASWNRILENLDAHFGESVEIEEDSRKVISDYLCANSAEYSSARRAVRIMRSLGNRVPMRITDIPCIRKAHHELKPEIFERKSIGSFSNCIACHTTAEKGIYDDDYVRIPQ